MYVTLPPGNPGPPLPLQSLVGEELADDPEQFRRRLQQAFQFAHCL